MELLNIEYNNYLFWDGKTIYKKKKKRTNIKGTETTIISEGNIRYSKINGKCS